MDIIIVTTRLENVKNSIRVIHVIRIMTFYRLYAILFSYCPIIVVMVHPIYSIGYINW